MYIKNAQQIQKFDQTKTIPSISSEACEEVMAKITEQTGLIVTCVSRNGLHRQS